MHVFLTSIKETEIQLMLVRLVELDLYAIPISQKGVSYKLTATAIKITSFKQEISNELLIFFFKFNVILYHQRNRS